MKITLEIEVIDGVPFVTSPQIDGLCAAHQSPYVTLSDVAWQIVTLAEENGSPNPWAQS